MLRQEECDQRGGEYQGSRHREHNFQPRLGDSRSRSLTSGKYNAKVEQETVTAAYLGGRGTPMFLVNEWLLVGAQPFETFQKVIGQALELSKDKPKPGR